MFVKDFVRTIATGAAMAIGFLSVKAVFDAWNARKEEKVEEIEDGYGSS